jgi:PqqD family protein of HPr-rel-A system
MWRLSADLLLYAPSAEDQAVVYQVASGDTHLVTTLAAQIIQWLQDGATSSALLLQHILDATPNTNTAELQPRFDTTLAELCRLDLITDTTA